VTDGVVSFESRPPSAAEFAERIASASATHAWLVDEVDGEIAGYAYGCPHNPRAAYRWAAEVSVYVNGAHHRRGIGRRLYEALLADLRELGVHVVCAGVTLPNDASVGLHESLGFEPVGVYRSIGWKAGRWWDVGWWQLRLLPQGTEPPAELSRRP
jgi:phosphinothricin acetyltransferase